MGHEDRPSTEEARASLAAIARSGIPVRRRDLVLFALSTNGIWVAFVAVLVTPAAESWPYWVVGAVAAAIVGPFQLLANLVRAIPRDLRQIAFVASLPCVITFTVAAGQRGLDWPVRLLIALLPVVALDVTIVLVGSRRT